MIDASVEVLHADASVGAVPVEVAGRTIALGTSVARFIWVEPE
jgi:Fe2+ transport system protein FeoA